MRKSASVSFNNKEGQKLAGILDFPLGPVRAYALFAHCFTCSKNLKAAYNISRALTDAGIAVLRFDFTGLGESEGAFAETGFSGNVADLHVAAGFLEGDYAAPALLVGHSLGGTAVLQAAADLPSVAAVATIGAPSHPAHVAQLFGDALQEIERHGKAQIKLGGRSITISREFVEDLERHALPESLSRLRKAILIMHAPLDDTVEIANASELFLHAKHPKSFVSLDKADHLLSRSDDSYYAGAVLATWASAYLPQREPATKASAANETIARTAGDAVRTELVVGGYELTADEPPESGGSGAGPTPYDLLSAALAACSTMTLTMYARHKKLDVNSVTAAVRHNRIHAADCADCETTDGKIDEFEREITIDGKLSSQERKRMLEIADRCPVHRTLHGEVKIRTQSGS